MPRIPKCPIHRVVLTCASCRAAASAAGNKGVSTKAKARAAKRNGRLGGRPPNHSPECEVNEAAHQTGISTKGCPRCQYDEQRARA